jgi:TP53 regulating kinase and related kinases
MEKNILAQGAEAIISLNGDSVIKDRIKKSYRYSILDEKLRRQRTKKEIKLLEKASILISVPKVIKQNDFSIGLQFINGKRLSESLDKIDNSLEICKQIGKNIAKLHDANIIHGDLTTSNMIISRGKIYFIDFGLGFESNKIEDKAVDLHLIKQALEAKHFKRSVEYFSKVLQGYKTSKGNNEIIKRLEKVEARGRYKEKY